jgi:cysteinyl-tRNA synthetase
MDYSETSLDQAKANLQKISAWVSNLKNLSEGAKNSSAEIDFSHIYKKRFEEAMDDDLNTPLALSVLYELIAETNKLLAENKLSAETAKNILNFWKKINKVLGLVIKEEKKEIPEEVAKLAEERKSAREQKDFQKSDELRKKIEELNYTIEDLKDNQYKIKKL